MAVNGWASPWAAANASHNSHHLSQSTPSSSVLPGNASRYLARAYTNSMSRTCQHPNICSSRPGPAAAVVVAGDVKPNNFVLRSLYPSIAHLLDPSRPKGLLEVIAVDFGCCQEVDDSCLPDLKVTGTPLYMAPEQLRACHGIEVDVWAAGVMVSGACCCWGCADGVCSALTLGLGFTLECCLPEVRLSRTCSVG